MILLAGHPSDRYDSLPGGGVKPGEPPAEFVPEYEVPEYEVPEHEAVGRRIES